MASVPLRSTAVHAAPKDYAIPAAQQIRLLSVRASFDGSGSAAAWLPAVQILDNNGNVLVTAADPNVSVAAGGSADVSWFPGVTVASSTAGAVNEVAYYEWDGTSTGAIPGTRKFGVSLRSSSNTAVFDASGGFARVKATGAIQGYAFIDWGTTETVTGGAITEYRFGIDFPAFPFYTVGGPWKTIPATPSVLVYDTEVTAEFYVNPATITCQPFVRSPAIAPGGDPANIFLVLVKLRDTWAF